MDEKESIGLFDKQIKYNSVLSTDVIKHYTELQSITLDKDLNISTFTCLISQLINDYTIAFFENSDYIKSGILEQVKNSFLFENFSQMYKEVIKK